MAHQPHPRSGSEGAHAALSAGADTIAAVATPPGRGGIGIVRLSGRTSHQIAQAIAGRLPAPRHAHFTTFRDVQGRPIDEGLVLAFAAPASYTGEDVVELQGHGGPVVLQQLLQICVSLGARIAAPGEFTRRAFLNGRLDLAQAEAVADLIEASSAQAARSAALSLSGEFSRQIHGLVAELIELRIHVEACIDFPEEEIAPADRAWQETRITKLIASLQALLRQASQGAVLREGLTVVLVGRPNVGKSSLMNALAGEDVAIVTPIPGTTRDYVKATITLEGVPVHLVDTAGLRDASDEVERLGIERAWRAVDDAGAVLFISDSDEGADEDARLLARIPADIPVARVRNKIDVSPASISTPGTIAISVRTGTGMDLVRQWILQIAGWEPHGEAVFMARGRHLAALEAAQAAVQSAGATQAYEFKAEELRIAQRDLGSITGEVSADALLGEIFARFCIGK